MSGYRNSTTSSDTWCRYAKCYDPIKIGSIDGTDTEPHDKGIVRAISAEYRPNRHVKGRPECTLFVARLSPKTTKDTIQDVFSKFGPLKRFRLVRDIVTGFPKGYAFIEYESEQAAEDAYRRAHRMTLDGQVIFVDFECERLLKGWKPRRLGGGFGGRKESGQLRFGGRDRPFAKPIALEMEEKKQWEREQREQKNLKRKRDERDSRDRSKHQESRARSRHREERLPRSRDRSRYRLERTARSRSCHMSDRTSRSRSRHRDDRVSRSRDRSRHRDNRLSRSRDRSQHSTTPEVIDYEDDEDGASRIKRYRSRSRY